MLQGRIPKAVGRIDQGGRSELHNASPALIAEAFECSLIILGRAHFQDKRLDPNPEPGGLCGVQLVRRVRL